MTVLVVRSFRAPRRAVERAASPRSLACVYRCSSASSRSCAGRVGRALRPVEAMRREADAITSAHLDRRLREPPAGGRDHPAGGDDQRDAGPDRAVPPAAAAVRLRRLARAALAAGGDPPERRGGASPTRTGCPRRPSRTTCWPRASASQAGRARCCCSPGSTTGTAPVAGDLVDLDDLVLVEARRLRRPPACGSTSRVSAPARSRGRVGAAAGGAQPGRQRDAARRLAGSHPLRRAGDGSRCPSRTTATASARTSGTGSSGASCGSTRPAAGSPVVPVSGSRSWAHHRRAGGRRADQDRTGRRGPVPPVRSRGPRPARTKFP